VRNHPKTAKIVFLKTKLRKLSFQFLNFEVSSICFGFSETDI